MRILIGNDDGIGAYGIRALARALAVKHKVIVVAPDEERSATSHAISLGASGLTYAEDSFHDGIRAYRVFGTPADCIKFGIIGLKLQPDLVIGGINHGHNLGSEIIYSGTVSAAFEGAYMHVRSIAVSCAKRDDPVLMDLAAAFIAERVEDYASLELPEFTILNVNYPAERAVGEVFTRMGVQLFSDDYVLDVDDKYYLRGQPVGYQGNDEDCDVQWILKNYVTVTPLQLDRTDHAVLARLKRSAKA